MNGVTAQGSPSPATPPASARTAPPAPDYVPVPLTTVVPVRVFDVHGEFFDTEIDLDAPLRVLQLAAEDFFKVKREVQLLLHNRQQISPELTLRESGCLLLKGDPYVKLVMMLKRGPLLNLVCHVGGRVHAALPIAVNEKSTVWEAKKLLISEMVEWRRRQRAAGGEPHGAGDDFGATPTPQQLRVLWRYMELNDKAELHYYRIPTNAALTVTVRPRSQVASERARSRSPHAGARAATPHESAAAGTEPWFQLQQHRVLPPPPSLVYNLRAAPPPSAAPPPPPAVVIQQTPRVVVAPSASPPAASAAVEEVRSLGCAVQVLQTEIDALRRQVAEQQQRSTHGDAALARSAAGFSSAAAHRIQELEDSVGRFQVFLQRAIALIS